MSALLYVQNVNAAVDKSEGLRLARLFSLRHSPALKMKSAGMFSSHLLNIHTTLRTLRISSSQYSPILHRTHIT